MNINIIHWLKDPKTKIFKYLVGIILIVAFILAIAIPLAKNLPHSKTIDNENQTVTVIWNTTEMTVTITTAILFDKKTSIQTTQQKLMTSMNNDHTRMFSDNPLSYWINERSLIQRRTSFDAALLANGKVIISGGQSNTSRSLMSTELYSLSAGWISGPFMKAYRSLHTLTRFANNTKVLAVGAPSPLYQHTAEVYNSANNTWTLTSTNLTTGRYAHTATLLNDDKILIIGGRNISGSIFSDVEFYSASSNSFTNVQSLNIARIYCTSTLLNDGSTLLVTGGANNQRILAVAELYISGSWIFTANNMNQPRVYHASVLLNNGNVLIAGGGNGDSASYSTAEIYNPNARTFSSVQSMKYRRALFTLTLLPSGQVLASGGVDWTTNTYPVICELYDPVTQSWSNTRILNTGRSRHRSILLNGSVLTIGGENDESVSLRSNERYYF